MTDLRGQLEKAQSERYANPLVYALAGLLALGCVVLAGPLAAQPAAPTTPRRLAPPLAP